jgi:spoIIIJ-associated protein
MSTDADVPEEVDVLDLEAEPAAADESLLVREGDAAADYLEGLLDIADLDGDIDIDVEGDRAQVSVVEAHPGELRNLVGRDGEVLEALQGLARLAATRETGRRSRLMLDVAGYRAGRRQRLETVAREAVAAVQSTGGPVRMEPMTSFERKVVHDVVAEAGLVSISEGEEPNRRVVVQPA